MMTRRTRIELNCQHGRLIDPNSHEADDILRTQTAECLTCPRQFGEGRVEGISPASFRALHLRVFGATPEEMRPTPSSSTDKIVGWLEQQPGAEEALHSINAGYPAGEVLADFISRQGGN